MENIGIYYQLLLYFFMAIQMFSWGFFSYHGGQIGNVKFYYFTAGMMLGQIGASIETFILGAWGAFAIQIYFLIFTFIGGLKRYKQAKSL